MAQVQQKQPVQQEEITQEQDESEETTENEEVKEPVEQVTQTQPIQKQPEAGQPATEEKSKWWIWLIVAAVVIGVTLGVYFYIK